MTLQWKFLAVNSLAELICIDWNFETYTCTDWIKPYICWHTFSRRWSRATSPYRTQFLPNLFQDRLHTGAGLPVLELFFTQPGSKSYKKRTARTRTSSKIAPLIHLRYWLLTRLELNWTEIGPILAPNWLQSGWLIHRRLEHVFSVLQSFHHLKNVKMACEINLLENLAPVYIIQPSCQAKQTRFMWTIVQFQRFFERSFDQSFYWAIDKSAAFLHIIINRQFH